MILLWNICLISPYSFGFVRLPKIFILLQLVGGVGAMLCCSFKSKGIYRNSLNRVEHELKNWNSKYSRYSVYIGMPIYNCSLGTWMISFVFPCVDSYWTTCHRPGEYHMCSYPVHWHVLFSTLWSVLNCCANLFEPWVYRVTGFWETVWSLGKRIRFFADPSIFLQFCWSFYPIGSMRLVAV